MAISKIFKKLLSFIMLALIVPAISNAQISEIQNNLQRYQQSRLTEKLFVHTDKDFYLAGEVLWLKAYYVDGIFNKPLNLSKVAYVEVVDDKNTPVLQAKVALKNSVGNASFNLPLTLNNGNYKLRAYTSWMKNFSSDYYFEKKITIVNSLKSPQNSDVNDEFTVQFFAEGGNLVSGLTSKIAVKATNTGGKSIGFQGAVIDQKSDTVVKFQSLKYGMGSFMFTPLANSKYRTVIKSNGKSIVKDLPAINDQGYVMAVSMAGPDNIEILLKSTSTQSENVYLLAHTRHGIKSAQSAVVNNGTAKFVVNKNSLGEGISHFTIFNSLKQPVCERLWFKRPLKKLQIDAKSDAQQYNTRKRVNIDISTKVQADMSLSVYKIDSLQSTDNQTIFGYLWLASDLKGYVEAPDYYLNNTDNTANEALDNLLLTQGWRRFNWNNIVHSVEPALKFTPEYEGHIITATVTDNAAKPANNVVAYLSVPGKKFHYYAARSDSNGRALFNTKDLYGTSEIIAQTNIKIDSTYRIDILSPFSEQYSSSKLPSFNLTALNEQKLQADNINMQVQRTYNATRLKRYYNPVTDSTAFYGKAVKRFRLDDYKRFSTLEEVYREYVFEVNVLRQQGKFHIRMINENGFLEDSSDPVVLLDGVPIFDLDKAMTINPATIQLLDAVPYKYVNGPSVQNGIVSLLTYKGDLGGFDIDPRAVILDYEGMQLQREFYSPIYETGTQSKSRIPDFRNVLLWSPNIHTDMRGKSQVSFFTSDQTGKFIGFIQGITPDGSSGSQYFMFEVKENSN
jgi:hypothetical protein